MYHIAPSVIVLVPEPVGNVFWKKNSTGGPVAPVGPVGPVSPVAPVGPVSPVAPVGPVSPVAPVAPVAPVGPVSPVAPWFPSKENILNPVSLLVISTAPIPPAWYETFTQYLSPVAASKIPVIVIISDGITPAVLSSIVVNPLKFVISTGVVVSFHKLVAKKLVDDTAECSTPTL